MAGVRVVVDMAAVEAILREPEAVAVAAEYGDRLAASARVHAAKDTGAGAASIAARPGEYGGQPESDVGWDNAHSYMFFDEVGTYKMAAHPALGPALDAYAQ
jgi:HK97 gp10 family phage protein